MRFRLSIHTSIFNSELFAIDKAIYYAINYIHFSISIYTDSMLALQATESGTTDKNEIQGYIINKLHFCRKSIYLICVPGHCCIRGNEQADILTNTVVEFEEMWNLTRDLQSCLSHGKSSVYLLWQRLWIHQYLPTVKPILWPWTTVNNHSRREEVILARLRMSCTCPIHLLPYISNNFLPICTICYNRLTISHILIHWRIHEGERRPFVDIWERKRNPFTKPI